MFRIIITALLLISQTAVASASTACAGADPALVSVVVKSVTHNGSVNRYNLTGTVVNLGSMRQVSSVLQSVDIYQTGEKLDAKSIPPLEAGQSYTFSYVAERSTEAANGTTKLRFQLDVRQPSPPGQQDCNQGNDTFTLTL